MPATELPGTVLPKRQASVTEREEGDVYHTAIKLPSGEGASLLSGCWCKHKDISSFSSLSCNMSD